MIKLLLSFGIAFVAQAAVGETYSCTYDHDFSNNFKLNFSDSHVEINFPHFKDQFDVKIESEGDDQNTFRIENLERGFLLTNTKRESGVDQFGPWAGLTGRLKSTNSQLGLIEGPFWCNKQKK